MRAWTPDFLQIWPQDLFKNVKKLFQEEHFPQDRRQLNWNKGGMDIQYKLLSELLSDQAAFITSPKTSLANYWGHCPPAPCPPVSTGLISLHGKSLEDIVPNIFWSFSPHYKDSEYTSGFSKWLYPENTWIRILFYRRGAQFIVALEQGVNASVI